MELNLFDGRGIFQKLPQDVLAALDPADRALYMPVQRAVHELEMAEADLQAALAVIEADVIAIDAAEAELRTYHAPSFHDEWKATTGGVTRKIGT